MQKTYYAIAVLFVGVLSVSGCHDRDKDGMRKEKDERGTVADACNPSTMQGTASLSISGNPGDSFRIVFACGDQTVSQCTATMPSGANVANCSDGPNPVPNGGERSCMVVPGSSNSGAAAVRTSACS